MRTIKVCKWGNEQATEPAIAGNKINITAAAVFPSTRQPVSPWAQEPAA